MKIRFYLSLLLILGVAGPARAGWFDSLTDHRIKVVTTTLELADFVKQVGGDKVKVQSLSFGKYDLHFFEPRPSHVMKVKKADILAILGMNADVWVKALIDASRNRNIRFGRKGYLDCSVGVKPVQVPTRRIQGDQGDVHPFGNPHYWYDRENVKTAIDNITRKLTEFSPKDQAYFQQNRDSYVKKVEAEFKRLKEMMAPFKGTYVVGYHRSWVYLANSFDLKVLGNMEPVPGVPPSPAHVARLIKKMRKEKVRILLIEPYYYLSVDFVSQNTGAKVLRVANYTGGIKGIDKYLDNLNDIITRMVKTLKKSK
ncbi:MAG: metal ABC transporter substrate-binding protein [bacterium]